MIKKIEHDGFIKSSIDLSVSNLAVPIGKTTMHKQEKAIGWYCIGHAGFENTTSFATYYKPSAIKRFFMRTLLDFYWIKDENK